MDRLTGHVRWELYLLQSISQPLPLHRHVEMLKRVTDNEDLQVLKLLILMNSHPGQDLCLGMVPSSGEEQSLRSLQPCGDQLD